MTLNDEKLLNDIKNSIKISKDFRFDNTDIGIKYLEDILDLIHRLQEEIERLTEVSIHFVEVCDINAELKKQVDELTKENERLSDLEFTQEHCDLYKENEWLKDMLRQYMNGEIVNEDIFCQQVEDMKQLRKYIVDKFAEMLKSDVSEDNELHERLNAYLKRDYFEYIDERCNEIMEGADNGK